MHFVADNTIASELQKLSLYVSNQIRLLLISFLKFSYKTRQHVIVKKSLCCHARIFMKEVNKRKATLATLKINIFTMMFQQKISLLSFPCHTCMKVGILHCAVIHTHTRY